MKRTPLKRTTALKRRPIVKTCEHCGAQFSIAYPSWADQRFCSRSCHYAAKRGKQSNESDESRARKSAYFSECRKGERNPNFKNGRFTHQRTRKTSRTVTRLFNLERKGEDRCRVCGSRDGLNAHHAVPRSMGTPESKVDLRNCLPLCASCHMRWHRGIPLPRSVFTAEEWDYISTLELTGRDITAWLDKHYPEAA